MNDLEQLKIIKLNNFKGYLTQLETIRKHSEVCRVAMDEYYDFKNLNLQSQQEWLSKYLDLGLLFEEIFFLYDFFNDDNDVKKGDLCLLDESVYGYKINVSRKYFEEPIKFKLLFQELFFEKKILSKELNDFNNLFISDIDGVPF